MFAYGVSQVPQLETFVLKVIQFELNLSLVFHLEFRQPCLTEECIETFAKAISKLKNLKNFDIYFRR